MFPLASSLSWKVLALIPWEIKTKFPANWTHTVFIMRSRNAPNASSNLPFASNIEKHAAGGSRATETITPTSDADMPVVIDNAAAAPEANAKTMSPIPISVLEIISELW